MSEENTVTFGVVGGYKIVGKRVYIKLANIKGYGEGRDHADRISPTTTCFVIREDKSYKIINPDDPRIQNFLSAYGKNTSVECVPYVPT